MSRVSVALCTFNGERFLPEQLGSLLTQTLLPAELVVCDDGSTDATESIVAAFAARAPFPVHWHRNAVNLGSTQNFARCIGLCTGDLIALADQDDYWEPEKLARSASVFARNPAVLCTFSNASLIGTDSQPIPSDVWTRFLFTPSLQAKMSSGDAAGVLLQLPVVTGATMTIRAELAQRALPISTPWIHDAWLAWIASLSGQVVALDEPLLRYRLHGAQQLGLAQMSGIQRLRHFGPAAFVRAEKDRTLKHYGQMATDYAALATFAEQHSLGTTAQRQALHDKAQFAQRALAVLEFPRILRTLPLLPLTEGYARFAPRGRKAMLRHAVL